MQAASLRSLRLVTLLVLFACPVQALPARAAVDGGPYVLRLERGDSLWIVRLEPATFGMFRYVRTDSIEGYLGWHKVRALMGSQGEDMAEDVRERRRAIGVDPLFYRREGSNELRGRHRSRREDRTFGIFEAGYYKQVVGPGSPYHEVGMMSADAGALRNLSRSLAVGGVLHFQIDEDRIGFGVGLRARRWLNNTFSVDGGAGWMFSGDDERGEFKPGAFFGEAAINVGDHLQLAASIESWRFARSVYGYGPLDSLRYFSPESQPYTSVTRFPPERETRVHIGAKVGRYPGMLLVVVLFFAGVGFYSTEMY